MVRHSIVWIWIGADEADISLIPPFTLLDDGAAEPATRRDYILMRASWDLIMDNLLDLSHAAFLHEGLLGNVQSNSAKTEVDVEGRSVIITRRYNDIPVTKFLDMLFRQDGANVDSFNIMRWYAPACMVNDTAAMPVNGTRDQGTGVRGTHFLTPETATTTHYHFAAVRWNIIKRTPEEDEWLQRQLSDIRRIAFEEQDERMFREQQTRIRAAKAPLKPMLLGIDAGIVRVHRILEQYQSQPF